MSIEVLAIAAGGMLLLSGLIALVGALIGVAPPAPPRPKDEGSRWRLERRWLLAGAAGLLGFLVTGWLAVGLGAAAAVLLVPAIFTAGAASNTQIMRLEGLSSWTRRMSDLLASGAASNLQEALARSAESSPDVLRPHLSALLSRMGPQGVEPALRAFAKEFDDPIADHVAMALIVRARHGGAGLVQVLHQVAADVDDRVRMVRGMKAERGKTIQNIRWLVVFMLILWTAAFLFARDFLAPYSDRGGQVALLVIVTVFGAALAWLKILVAPTRGTRFLTDTRHRRQQVS